MSTGMWGETDGRYKNVYICFYLYCDINGCCSGDGVIDSLFALENTFKEWTVSLEFMTGTCMILVINLIDYLRA